MDQQTKLHLALQQLQNVILILGMELLILPQVPMILLL